jgi:hypothetical protein
MRQALFFITARTPFFFFLVGRKMKESFQRRQNEIADHDGEKNLFLLERGTVL